MLAIRPPVPWPDDRDEATLALRRLRYLHRASALTDSDIAAVEPTILALLR